MSAQYNLSLIAMLLAGGCLAGNANALELQPIAPVKQPIGVAKPAERTPPTLEKPAFGMVPAFNAQPLGLSPQLQSQLKILHQQDVQRVMSQHVSDSGQRLQTVRSTISAKKVQASALANGMADCLSGPRIHEVSPATLMPGDPLVVTGCGFNASTGMVLLSDDNRQLAITSWSDNAIEAMIPPLSGFAEPKNVTLSVVTVAAKKSSPSAALTIKPTLVLKEISPTGVTLSGCGDQFIYGIVQHQVQAGEPANCTQGNDTVKFGMQLKNNWSFHSLVFSKLCTASNTPCGGGNNANPSSGGYQLGKTYLPDLPVSWQGYVGYYPAIMVMGPEGTSP